MKRFYKSCLSFVLVFIFVFGFFPYSDYTSTYAADPLIYGDFKYTVNTSDKTAEIVSLSATLTFSSFSLSVPSKIDEYTVTSIAPGAFKNTITLLSVTIPDTVTNIGSEAFSGCTALASLSLGNGIKTIGSKAFYNCLLISSINFPKTVIEIGPYAFYGCSSLTNLDFSRASALKTIGEYAFSECFALPTVSLPATVITLGKGAFKNCTALSSAQLPSSLVAIEDELFSGCSKLRELSIYSSLTRIGVSAFENCKSLTSVIIPNSVIRVDSKAFSGCSGITSVAIGDGLGGFDASSFSGCTSLQSFSVSGNKAYSVSDGILFDSTGKKLLCYPAAKSGSSYTIDSNVNAIGAYAFDSCKNLTKLTIPSTVKTFAKPVVNNCPSLTVYVEDASAAESYFSSYKTGIGALIISGNSARIEAQSVFVSTGETFDVDINLVNNPGLTAATFTVTYDIGKLRYVTFKDPKLLNGCRVTTNLTGNTITISFADSTATSNVTTSGKLITLTFEALPLFTSGSTPIKLSVDANDTYDVKQNAVSLKANDGTVTIGKAESTSKPGDVNKDGIIDSKDVILTRRYVADWKNITIDTDAADVNNDAIVDSKDVILLRRYVADWKDITLI